MNDLMNLKQSTVDLNRDIICEALSDGYFLYLNTLNAHWNIEGGNFIALHTLLETQYEQLKDTIDALAERMRMLGVKAPADYDTYYKNSKLTDNKLSEDYVNQTELQLKLLSQSYSKAIKALRANIEEVSKTNDFGTEDLLVSTLKQYEKNLWMLYSQVRSNTRVTSNQAKAVDNVNEASK